MVTFGVGGTTVSHGNQVPRQEETSVLITISTVTFVPSTFIFPDKCAESFSNFNPTPFVLIQKELQFFVERVIEERGTLN
jgi:hypothetical protein